MDAVLPNPYRSNGQAKAKPAPISCGTIATELSRHPVSIARAIERLRIQPVLITEGGFKFYDADILDLLRIKMRRRNGHSTV